MARYIPQRGDFVILTLDPQTGQEQKGRRSALVISNYLFNKHTGLAIVCPITNANKNMPFHIPVPDQSSLAGYIMVEQVKSIDFVRRELKYIEKAPQETVVDVLGILDAAVYQDP